MNWLDMVLGAIILLSAFASARKGLSREVIGLAASLVGLLCAIWFYRTAGARLEPYVSSHLAASLGGFIAIFFGVMIVGGILSAVVGRFLKTFGLSLVDRLLGAAFGLARGMLFSFGIVMLVLAVASGARGGEPPDAVVHSRLAPYLIELSHLVAHVAPDGVKESFERKYEQVKLSWQRAADQPAR
ncbi:MAG: Colicin production protein [Bryobacterales bacterium]|nr:Colicin production protein [Bryobacterales bacterium]